MPEGSIMPLSIRDLTVEDKAAWHALWADYLAFYDITLTDDVLQSTWKRMIDPSHPMTCRLAEVDGRVAGFAIHHHHCSTWVAGEDCYLEDLFVDASARGKGLGRALIHDLITIARAKGWHRLYWHTDEGNATARQLYDSFIQSDNHIRYRLDL
jgi:GNAT superfamily N-acetyltransferase